MTDTQPTQPQPNLSVVPLADMTPQATEPVVQEPDEESVPSVSKDELKGLLQEIVDDIQEDKSVKKVAESLTQELAEAKQHFIDVVTKVENTIAKLGK